MTIKTIKGVCSELIAAKEFLNKGYYVAKSLDPQCPFDLIVVNKKGKTRLLDVKSVSYRKTRSYNCRIGTTINRSVSKKESMIVELVQFVRGKPNEEKKKITYAYFEKKEYERKRKLN